MGNESKNNTNNSALKGLLPSLKLRQAGNALTTLFFYLSVLFFIIGFNFTDTPTPFGWYQQFMPNIGNRQINDITFIDSLTGWGVTNATNQNNDTTFVLKTTNGGDNWTIQYRKIQTGGGFSGYTRIYFLNQFTGYTSGVTGFDKSTDGVLNWTSIWSADTYADMSIFNTDTIWLISSNSLTGGVFRTTNGGVNWTQQLSLGSQNPSRIYMFNRNIGFISEATGQTLRMTTNSGINWTTFSTAGAFTDMFFSDSLTGWKSGAPGGPGFRKTTDGGLNWFDETLPQGGNIVAPQIERFSNIIKDTIWGAGAIIITPTGLRGMVDRTTNGGNIWYFQVPDTSIHISQYHYCKFINKLNGWAYTTSNTGIHTVTGGDSTFYLPVKQVSSEIPKQFKLFQNYPNPFNPVTNFKFQISRQADIKVIIYDITGELIQILVNKKLNAGEYKADFDGTNYSSGVYFYSLFANGNLIETKKMILIK
jgi:photosystem II stability/assembly factor-like uncharacterized protein